MIMDNRFLVARRRYDPDATRYINAVQLADGQALEPEVAMAVDAFVRGCKADGIWNAIKASCIMCGARTISGALVPLVGTAPTPYNFASGDYDRSSGLKGNGATKYLDTNRANDADGQDDMHISAFQSSASAATASLIGSSTSSPECYTQLTTSGTSYYPRANNITATMSPLSGGADVGLFAASRTTSAFYVARPGAGSSVQVSIASTDPPSQNVFVFNGNKDGVPQAGVFSSGRLAFYSIGSSLDLAALDNRVSTLVSQIAAAIP